MAEEYFWAEVCCYEPRENIWSVVYTKKWQKDFQVEGKKWKLMELMGNKINILDIFSWEFPWDQQRGRAWTHLHHSWRAPLIQHLCTLPLIISCFSFIIGCCLIFPPKWPRSNCSLACVNKKSRPVILHVLEQHAWDCGNSNLVCVWRVVASHDKTKADSGKMKKIAQIAPIPLSVFEATAGTDKRLRNL